MGYFFIFLSIFFVSVANIFDKILSGRENRDETIMIRYFGASLILFIGIILSGVYPDFQTIGLLLMGLGCLNYLILLLMYHGLKMSHTGLFFVVGYLYIPFLYVVNIILFGKEEILSTGKSLLGVFFLLSVAYLVYITGQRMKTISLWAYFFAFLCAIGWTLSIGISTLVVKSGIISPIHIFFYEVLGSWMIASVVFIVTHLGLPLKKSKESHITPFLGGAFLAIGMTLLFLSYTYLPANIVNILSLSDLMFTTLLGYIFLHERLSKKVVSLLLLSFILLIAFSRA